MTELRAEAESRKEHGCEHCGRADAQTKVWAEIDPDESNPLPWWCEDCLQEYCDEV